MAEMVLFCVIVGIILIITMGNIANYIQNNKDFNIYKIHILEKNDLGEKLTFPILKIKTECGMRLNFLLDTGANVNVINSDILSKISYDMSENTEQITSLNKENDETYTIMLDFILEYNYFREEFASSDMSLIVDKFEDCFDITIHGIIGCKFFAKHKCVINF